MTPLLGMTTEHFQSVWIEQEFYRQFFELTVCNDWSREYFSDGGDIGGLRFGSVRFKLGILDSHDCLGFQGSTTLCTGIRLPSMVHQFSRMATAYFWGSRTDLIRPTLGDHCGTRINQPAFHDLDAPLIFQNIPRELDEAARIDGCSHGEAFVRVIIPVMWPGVLTAGLFSFLLAYNDYLVAALLLDAQNQTMVPAISGYFNRETTSTDQVEAVAAAVSITAPLFVLVMVFQKQLVAGLTQGAVKGEEIFNIRIIQWKNRTTSN